MIGTKSQNILRRKFPTSPNGHNMRIFYPSGVCANLTLTAKDTREPWSVLSENRHPGLLGVLKAVCRHTCMIAEYAFRNTFSDKRLSTSHRLLAKATWFSKAVHPSLVFAGLRAKFCSFSCPSGFSCEGFQAGRAVQNDRCLPARDGAVDFVAPARLEEWCFTPFANSLDLLCGSLGFARDTVTFHRAMLVCALSDSRLMAGERCIANLANAFNPARLVSSHKIGSSRSSGQERRCCANNGAVPIIISGGLVNSTGAAI